MRHKIKEKKINRTSKHRKSMLANMAISLVTHEQVKTTVTKAKILRPYLEKLVTNAKKGTLSARRYILASIKDKSAVKKLMSVIANRYISRPGGYTRIIKSGFRYGDRSPLAYIEFVNKDLSYKGKIETKTKTTN